MTDNNTTRRRFLQTTGGAAAAVALAGCSGGGDDDEGEQDDTDTRTTEPETETTEREQVQSDKTYRRTNSTMTTFDPVALTDEASIYVAHNLFDALTNYPNGDAQTVENLLAEELEITGGGSEITVTLRDDVSFTGDYGDVTASDVVYSFERLAASDNSRRASFLLGDLGVQHETNSDGAYVPGSMAIEAADEKTVNITLDSPFHAIAEILAYDSFAIHPEGIVGDIEGYDGDMSYEEFAQENPVGAGAFTLDHWDSGSEAVLNARPIDDYHEEGPYVSSVHFRIAEDPNALYTYTVINENADHPVIPNAQYDPDKVSIESRDSKGRDYGTYGPLENGRTVSYYQVEEIVTYYIAFNQQNVPKPVRQAFAHVTNQDQIVNEVLKKPGKTAPHYVPPGIFPGGVENYESHAEEYPYGIDETRIGEAQSIMEEAGYGDDNMYELEFTTYESGFWEETASILRDQLASAYIDLSVQPTQFSTLIERGRNGDLAAYTLGWGMDYPAPDNFLKLLNPPQTDTSLSAPISYVDWDPEESEAAQQAADAWQQFKDNPDPEGGQEARNEAYLAMEEANWEDVVFLNIYHPITEGMDYQWVNRPRFGGAGPASQKFANISIDDRE
ncbi:ABC transporter substrate-binding protein [Halostella sp. JP-L12]|uniref:ABC transporter substrate-binding protein n=1 Tax=Halostella TaxID=1843185 RepID=UPI000EF79585|nr:MULTISPECIES: ABC transporter substrate-binding protein [Halostella]NHN46146.1 ABC transporter substrate-binding protein [Halostella sp. JP-L12]